MFLRADRKIQSTFIGRINILEILEVSLGKMITPHYINWIIMKKLYGKNDQLSQSLEILRENRDIREGFHEKRRSSVLEKLQANTVALSKTEHVTRRIIYYVYSVYDYNSGCPQILIQTLFNNSITSNSITYVTSKITRIKTYIVKF